MTPWPPEGPEDPIELEFVLAPSRSIPEPGAPADGEDEQLSGALDDHQVDIVCPREAGQAPEQEPRARRRHGSEASGLRAFSTTIAAAIVLTKGREVVEVTLDDDVQD